MGGPEEAHDARVQAGRAEVEGVHGGGHTPIATQVSPSVKTLRGELLLRERGRVGGVGSVHQLGIVVVDVESPRRRSEGSLALVRAHQGHETWNATRE